MEFVGQWLGLTSVIQVFGIYWLSDRLFPHFLHATHFPLAGLFSLSFPCRLTSNLWLELGSQVDPFLLLLLQHGEDLYTMRAEPAGVIANSFCETPKLSVSLICKFHSAAETPSTYRPVLTCNVVFCRVSICLTCILSFAYYEAKPDERVLIRTPNQANFSC